MVRSILPEAGTATAFKGIVPFFPVDLVRLAILVLLPGFVLFLPSPMR